MHIACIYTAKLDCNNNAHIINKAQLAATDKKSHNILNIFNFTKIKSIDS